jgi:hypothetical protein
MYALSIRCSWVEHVQWTILDEPLKTRHTIPASMSAPPSGRNLDYFREDSLMLATGPMVHTEGARHICRYAVERTEASLRLGDL